MSKDLLTEATRALRESEDASELEVRATRTRVMTGLHQTRVRRRTRLAFLLPIAATFVAASAWGAASGQARRVFEHIELLLGVSVSPSSAGARGGHAARAVGAAPHQSAALSAPLASAPVPVSAPLAGTATAAPLLPAATPALNNAASASAPKTRIEASYPTLALYRAAHAAHFVQHDPARALAAWDAYLAAAPNGELAPEARYNRALSLVRLGRSSEARSALEPFANGSYGGYRAAEASALLELLSQ